MYSLDTPQLRVPNIVLFHQYLKYMPPHMLDL
jgi:hypothetical protein